MSAACDWQSWLTFRNPWKAAAGEERGKLERDRRRSMMPWLMSASMRVKWGAGDAYSPCCLGISSSGRHPQTTVAAAE